MDITEILLSAQSSDQTRRTEAEKVLKNAEESNFPAYLVHLVDQLSGEANNPDSRRLAGLIIKNAIDAKDPAVRAHLTERWIQTVDDSSKQHVRISLFKTLSSAAPEARRAAAQVIAKIAAVDLSRQRAWDNLIPDLLSNCMTPTSPDHLRQASLEALGYICEEAGYGELTDHVLTLHSNHILTAVINGMTYAGNPSNGNQQSAANVRLAATVALNNALEFARAQFEIAEERSAIVTTIAEAARAGDDNVRQAAFEGLVKIGENYYDKLPEYISVIYSLTENAIRNDIEPVALQAIEFWSTIAEEEIALLFEADPTAPTPDRESKRFVIHALPFLSVPLFDSLKKQEDDPLEDSSWNAATAAGSCLELLAQAAPDDILNVVKPFIEANIQDKANWRSREAAILAFGSVLEGPPVDDIKALVRDAIQVLIDTLVNDPHLAVKDTTAWTLARVVLIDRETTVAHLPALVESLRNTIRISESPVLAAHLCFAIHNLAECFSEEAEQETGSLREHIEVLLQSLIQCADRDDATEGHLRITAYEAVNALFRGVSKDGIEFVYRCVPILLEKLQGTISAAPRTLSDDDVSELLEQQGLLCGALTTATQRLSASQLSPYADRMMEAYLQVFRLSGSAAVLEEALLAVGAVADTVGKEFGRYMAHFMPILQQALTNVAHHQICAIAVAVVGEVSRAMGKDIIAFSDNIVYLLLEALKSPTLDRSVKPPILSCFGDVALAVKGSFENYLKQVMECMQQAAESSVRMDVPTDDFDTEEWIHLLRESIFEAYIGIINGLRDDSKQELLIQYADWIVAFCEVTIKATSQNGTLTDEIIKPVSGLLGDLVDAIPRLKDAVQQKAWVYPILERGSSSTDERTMEVAKWAIQTIFQ